MEEDKLEQEWDKEWQKHLMCEALKDLKIKVESKTYMAFDLYAIQNRPSTEVANFLNISVNSVYVAKNRCVELLKNIIAENSEC